MKKLSKRSENFIELALKLEDVGHISLSKHDVKILYNYYKNSHFEIMKLENQLEVGEEQYNDLVEEKEKLQEELDRKNNYEILL